ncbi:uncharacterized protein BDV17DRAFT_17034 [Aspergillus undulatus]|uniref:uncharacterized protein n=1 Tax=Aspergillus undulatus TaxID=1810928 RepID=UPI003CCC96F7
MRTCEFTVMVIFSIFGTRYATLLSLPANSSEHKNLPCCSNSLLLSYSAPTRSQPVISSNPKMPVLSPLLLEIAAYSTYYLKTRGARAGMQDQAIPR